MASPEMSGERKETGRSLIAAGWVVLLFDAMILFFYPSALRIGDSNWFLLVIVGLAVIALGMIIAGYSIRGRAARRL